MAGARRYRRVQRPPAVDQVRSPGAVGRVSYSGRRLDLTGHAQATPFTVSLGVSRVFHSNLIGNTDRALCDELGISTRQFRRWRDEELAGLKRELAQVKKERDFLTEAAARTARHA